MQAPKSPNQWLVVDFANSVVLRTHGTHAEARAKATELASFRYDSLCIAQVVEVTRIEPRVTFEPMPPATGGVA